MDLRALVVGALLGFSLALAPSCGGGGGTGTCGGCVDGSGRCVEAQDVSGQACGTGGAACRACGPGESCQEGSCSGPDGGTQAVGLACSDDAECTARLGAGALCKQATSSGSARYPGGICTRPCGDTQPACPTGSVCLGGLELFGEQGHFCWDTCAPGAGSADACREGYACYTRPAPEGDRNLCWLASLPDPSAPAGFAGKPCQVDTDCAQPPYAGRCLRETLSDGGEAYPGGLCSLACDGLTQTYPDLCGTDGVCVEGFFVNVSVCMQGCREGMEGQGDPADGGCRDGYVCQSFEEDGGLSSDGFCAPSCAVEGCGEGRACATTGARAGYCLLPDGGF